MPTSKSEFDTRKPFSGSRALVALAIGCTLGAAVAYFLKVLIENTPAEINILRLRLFYLMVITSGGLDGFATSRCVNSRRMQRIRCIAIKKPSA